MKVQPIRDIETVKEIERVLAKDASRKGRCKYLLFVCGIYLARRVCDILPMRVSDLLEVDANEKVHAKKQIAIKERKTKKIIYLPIPDQLQRFARRELKSLPMDAYIFLSRQRDKHGEVRPISYKTAYNYMKEIAVMMDMPYNVATHTMRKTFGYHYYQRTKDIATLMVLFNHFSEKDTKIYIGIEMDELTKAVQKFRY